MRNAGLALLALLILLCACGEGGRAPLDAPPPEVEEGPHLYVQVAAELEKQEYELGEAVVVRRVFENRGPKPGLHTRQFGRDNYQAVVIRSGRAAGLYDAKWLEAPDMNVRRGERVEGRLQVELSQPGTFEIEVPPEYVARQGFGEALRLPVTIVDRGDPGRLAAKAERLRTQILLEDDGWPSCWTEAQSDLSGHGEAAVPYLRRWLRESDSAYLRAVSAKLLAAVKGSSGKPELLAGLRDADPKVRKQCLEALACFRDADTLGAMLETARDADPWVRAEAYTTLAGFDDPRVLAVLREGVNDADEHARLWAATYLAEKKDDPAGIHVLIAALRSDAAMYASIVAPALEKLTGESFGAPGSPLLHSGFDLMEEAQERCDEVAGKWLAWWEEQGRARFGDPGR